jgi:hypothetical protein
LPAFTNQSQVMVYNFVGDSHFGKILSPFSDIATAVLATQPANMVVASEVVTKLADE